MEKVKVAAISQEIKNLQFASFSCISNAKIPAFSMQKFLHSRENGP